MKKTRLLIIFSMLLFSLGLVTVGLAAGRDSLPVSARASQAPSLVLTKTVGTAAGVCASTSEITVTSGTSVHYCYLARNTGTVTFTFTTHSLTDTQLAVLLNNAALNLAPGGQLMITQTVALTETTINTATWNARTVTGTASLASDSAIVNTQLPQISMNKTVGLSDSQCAVTNSRSVEPGTQVTFCYEVTNTGPVTVTSHTLVDDQLGTLLTSAAIVIGPGESYQHLETVVAGTAVTNEGTWTATDADGNEAQGSDTAIIRLLPHSVLLNKTVSDDGLCGSGDSIVVQPGTLVTYCYEMLNNSPITLTDHTLIDNQLGLFLNSDATILAPASSFVFSTSAVVTQTTLNSATWTAIDSFSNNSVANDNATVTALTPQVSLAKTISVLPTVCQTNDTVSVSAGTQVNYCFEITNTGPVTVASHTLVDTHLGTLLTDSSLTLGPGQSFVFSQTAVINSSVVNTATVTSSEPFGNQAMATDSARVNLVTVTLILTKTVSVDPAQCSPTHSIFVIPSSMVNYCYEIENTGSITLTPQSMPMHGNAVRSVLRRNSIWGENICFSTCFRGSMARQN